LNIIIAGAGKVGFNLAKTLCIGHNVIIIDKNKEALNRIGESLDIYAYFGDIKDPNTYTNFVDMDIDLFIAVTNSDDANIISTIEIDSVLKVNKKFVRLQNDFYQNDYLKEKLNIDKLIFPAKLSSRNIASLINYPKLNNIKGFKYTDYKVISIFCEKDMHTEEFQSIQNRVVGIEKKKTFYIDMDEVESIKKGDLIYLLAKEDEITSICSIFSSTATDEIKKCVLFGINEVSISIAKILLENKKDVKMVEKDITLCQKAEEELEGRVHIINSKYQNEELFVDENLDKADVCISTYKDDEYNIIKSIEAKEFGIEKTIAINNDSEYYNLMHKLGIVALRGEKISAYHSIIEHINSSGVILEKFFCGGKGIVFLRKIFKNSSLIGKNISRPFVKNSKFFIIRDNELKLLDSETLKEDDIILAIAISELSSKVKIWIYEL
jgi:trk system potassium uptake protein TrkA